MADDEPQTEAEFLERESQLAKDSLLQVRGEVFDSLSRTADVNAWTERYPWPALGTAAVAGIATGWGLGRTLWGSWSSARAATAKNTASDSQPTPTAGKSSAAASLVGGLGTLASAMVSAVIVAASEAVKDIVKEKVHDTLNPEPAPEEPGNPPTSYESDDTPM